MEYVQIGHNKGVKALFLLFLNGMHADGYVTEYKNRLHCQVCLHMLSTCLKFHLFTLHLVGFEITAVLYLHPFLAEFSPAQVPW